ncbi:hypothetical protein L1987_25215 [Smallanthus sonchifolius]|uniref:Uncharacterized protein n=1 Tax=Smallanthus sonchifolius TaxID=185202 RepID=A0ACB9IP24_9ASTR|nr:hypothetical protein L1987_25215 [Smallanthus sonchifolius]
MLAGVISSRPKHWLLGSPIAHYALTARHRHIQSDVSFPIKLLLPASECISRRLFPYHSTATGLKFSTSDVSASVWHAILPAGNIIGKHNLRPAGEGSWNVAWDVRPARWLHRPYTAWLLFGICACLAAPPVEINDTGLEPLVADDNKINANCITTISENSTNYKITGVPADGRCLFRAIAHMVCLRNGEGAPDENQQKELADELRAQVVDELLKRRKEIEWFIEEDFDVYVKRIEKPYVWGGEPELLMASHVLKTAISVFMLERSTQKLLNIATYGKEYEKDDKSLIKVLFHGYGHYDILEDI